MDAFISRPLSRLAPPPGFEPSTCGRGGAMMHTNPFSLGLDIALPSPAGFGPFSGGGGPVHALRGDPSSFGFDPYSGAAAVHALHGNPFSFGFDSFYGGAALNVPRGDPFSFGLDPYSGGAAEHALHTTNPFSYGFDDIAHPPLTGYDPFSGGATVHSHEHGNPFAVDPWGGLPPPAVFYPFSTGADTHTGPTNLDDYPALPAADSPRTPVYDNPFNADGAAAIAMEVPAPWEWDLYSGHAQPAVDEPVSPRLIPAPAAPVSNDDGACKNSTPARVQLCASYDDDNEEAILRAQENDAKALPSPDYLETTQGGRMSPEARSDLVRWMSGLTQRYDLTPGTLHRAVSYADRFLSARPLADATAHRLNLLGAAAVFAAAKYEDQGAVHKLDAGEIARYGRFAAGREVVAMERALLAALGYRLGGPTAHTFVEHFTRGYGQEEEDDELQFRAHDFANVSLLHYGCLELRPSAVAAAALFLAMRTLKPSYRRAVTRGRELEELTGYKPKDLERGVDAIRSLIPKDGGNGFDADVFPMFYADPGFLTRTDSKIGARGSSTKRMANCTAM
ncbi:putative cyclin-F2-1 [Setaria viridis]|uniref:putative cyclin-F2-1 n=1 Tax=Setaria viridis TaxID=4556 RepID=UPI003B3AC5F7